MERNAWLGVEVRHLAALAAVWRTGSFRGAAEDLGYVQSAVSQQIARLERVVGARLVERTRGHASVALTPAGEVLLEHAEGILARLRTAQADLGRLAGGEREAVLRVGVHESVAARVLPEVLPALARGDPPVRVTALGPSAGDDAARQVAVGELDAAFEQLPVEAGPLEQLEVLRDTPLLLVPADSPLARRPDPPSAAEIARLPLIEHGAWRMLTPLDDGGHAPRFVQRSNLDSVVQALVAAGAGAAIVPRLAFGEDRQGVAAIDLGDVLPPVRIALLWHRDRDSEALRRLREAVARALPSGAAVAA
jgi:DNA-binding transcriptional LysR family regulator